MQVVRTGITRTVILIGRYAVKVPSLRGGSRSDRLASFCHGVLANKSERQWHQYEPWQGRVAPVLRSWLGGIVQVYPRCAPVPLSRTDEALNFPRPQPRSRRPQDRQLRPAQRTNRLRRLRPMRSAMADYKVTADHPVNVAGGRVMGAGETGDIDPTLPDNVILIELGQLTALQVPAAEASAIEAPPAIAPRARSRAALKENA